MGNDWQSTSLGEFSPFVYGKALPATKRNENGAIPVFGSGGLSGYHDEALVDQKGIIIGRKGTVGSVTFSEKPFWPIDTTFYITEKEGQDLRFTYYLLQTLGLNEMNADSAVPGLNRDAAHSVKFNLPSFEEQKAIAHILGTLDNKIELNRQMNETLEAMAQALFKSWFVDFDPVIDNALAAGNEIPEPLQKRAAARQALGDQRKPLPADIQSLFPDRFVFTVEMGWIPEGWDYKELQDIGFDIESGRRPKGGIDKSLVEGIPSVGAESICSIGEFDYGKTKYVSKEFSATAKKGWVKDYDVVLYKDGGKPGEFRPRLSMYGEGFPYQSLMVNEHVFLLRSESLGQPYLYYAVSSFLFLQQLIAKGSAKAAQPGLNQNEVGDSKLILPSSEVLSLFNREMQPLLSKRFALGKNSQVLAELRDNLLPKLLAGELRISRSDEVINSIELKTIDDFVDHFVAKKTVVNKPKQDTNIVMFKMVLLEPEKNTTTYYSFKLKHLRDKLTSVFNLKNAGLMTAFTTALNIEVNSQEIYNFVMSPQSQFSTAILALLITTSSSVRNFFKAELVCCNAIAIITALHQNNGALHEDRLHAISNDKLIQNKLSIMNYELYLTILNKLESCGLLKSTKNRTWFLQDEVKYMVK